MSKIYIDTNILIHLLNNEASLANDFINFQKITAQKEFIWVTTDITLTEYLTGVLKLQGEDDFIYFDDFFATTDIIKFIPTIRETYIFAARMRVAYSLKTPDSLHLATAILAQCSHFITQDRRIRLNDKIQVVTLQDFNKEFNEATK